MPRHLPICAAQAVLPLRHQRGRLRYAVATGAPAPGIAAPGSVKGLAVVACLKVRSRVGKPSLDQCSSIPQFGDNQATRGASIGAKILVPVAKALHVAYSAPGRSEQPAIVIL